MEKDSDKTRDCVIAIVEESIPEVKRGGLRHMD